MQAEQVEQARSQGEAGLRVTTCYNRTGPAGWEILASPDPPPDEGEDAEATEGKAG